MSYARNKNNTTHEITDNVSFFYSDLKCRNSPTQTLTQDSLKLIIIEEQLQIVPDPRYVAIWFSCTLEKIKKCIFVDDKETEDLSTANHNNEVKTQSGPADSKLSTSPRFLRGLRGKSRTYNTNCLSPMDSNTEESHIVENNPSKEDSSVCTIH
jgi:hypothetical protein